MNFSLCYTPGPVSLLTVSKLEALVELPYTHRSPFWRLRGLVWCSWKGLLVACTMSNKPFQVTIGLWDPLMPLGTSYYVSYRIYLEYGDMWLLHAQYSYYDRILVINHDCTNSMSLSTCSTKETQSDAWYLSSRCSHHFPWISRWSCWNRAPTNGPLSF